MAWLEGGWKSKSDALNKPVEEIYDMEDNVPGRSQQ